MCEAVAKSVSFTTYITLTHHRSPKCPVCRTNVAKALYDHRAQRIVDIYLKMHPTKQRSQKDAEELDKLYQKGTEVTSQPSCADSEDIVRPQWVDRWE